MAFHGPVIVRFDSLLPKKRYVPYPLLTSLAVVTVRLPCPPKISHIPRFWAPTSAKDATRYFLRTSRRCMMRQSLVVPSYLDGAENFLFYVASQVRGLTECLPGTRFSGSPAILRAQDADNPMPQKISVPMKLPVLGMVRLWLALARRRDWRGGGG